MNVDIREKFKIINCGNLVYIPDNMQYFINILQNHIKNFFSKKIFLGRNHYLTLSILWDYSKFLNKIIILHFDVYVNYCINNGKYDHGSILLHALTEELFDPNNHSVRIGIRTDIM